MGSLWGITADGWMAIATFSGAFAVVVTVLLSARRFFEEQEARDVRTYLVDEGAWKLQASLDGLLQVIRQNYATGSHMAKAVEDVITQRATNPTFSGSLESFPRLTQFDNQRLHFDAIRPASRLLDCMELGALATHALGILFNVHLVFVIHVEPYLRSYYAGPGHPPTTRSDVEELERIMKSKWQEAEAYQDLPGWLEDAGLRVQEMRISRFRDIDRIHSDQTIKKLATNIRDMWAKTDKAGGEA